ncbi:MAG: DNA-processing protein DprA [Chitinophagales bacterium]|nr:DNA-processing protein DprA [Chitinophagales bacterium]MDW8428486.1 DNA-processing protein DprA [Chitinophagales bacterium]
MISHDARLFQIALTCINGIGDVLARSLVSHLGSAEEVFRASMRRLMEVPGISRKRAEAIKQFNEWSKVEAELQFMQRNQIRMHFIQDEDYPHRLRMINDAPVLLYSKGNLDLNAARMIAIVGTRRCSEHGRLVAQQFVRDLKPYQPVIVSGLAYGIDIIAHQAALQEGLPTVAVLAHGLNRIYPHRHSAIARAMMKNGGLLTEFRHTDAFEAQNFPLRNRIIAGLCDATIVVETAREGGALITARLAAGYDRDVFCVPGRPTDRQSQGCNALIRSQLAMLAESADDVVTFLNWKQPQPPQQSAKVKLDLTPEEHSIMQVLQDGQQVHVDVIADRTKLPASALAMALLNLELKDLVVALPGKQYRCR